MSEMCISEWGFVQVGFCAMGLCPMGFYPSGFFFWIQMRQWKLKLCGINKNVDYTIWFKGQ